MRDDGKVECQKCLGEGSIYEPEMNAGELLPCPFCGGEAEAVYIGFSQPNYYIECKSCGCRTRDFAGPESGQHEAWKRRVANSAGDGR